MIKTFAHKGLKRFFISGDPRGVCSEHIKKLCLILIKIDTAKDIEDINAPGLKLHKLKGELKDFWAVSVNANWRVYFKFIGGNAFDLNYGDYH